MDAADTIYNLPLPGGTYWESYRVALLHVIQRVKQFDAQALVVSMGWDTLVGDPVAFPQARFNLLPTDGSPMGQLLLYGGMNSTSSIHSCSSGNSAGTSECLGLRLPTIVVQEGGYALDLVPTAISSFLNPN